MRAGGGRFIAHQGAHPVTPRYAPLRPVTPRYAPLPPVISRAPCSTPSPFHPATQVRPEQIGIITPFVKQVSQIRKAFGWDTLKNKAIGRAEEKRTGIAPSDVNSAGTRYTGIRVGTTEAFQGMERDVIIISTVRTRFALLAADIKFKLGMVGQPKRTNVAISRAKALLIVLGSTELLQADPTWRKLLRAVDRKGGYTGPALDCLRQEETDDGAHGEDVLLTSAAQPAGSDSLQEHDLEGEGHDAPWRSDY